MVCLFCTVHYSWQLIFIIRESFILHGFYNFLGISTHSDSPTVQDSQSDELQQAATIAVSKIPRLVDKRKHMEKALSQAQRDQLLMNSAKEDAVMKKEMLKSFERSNKTMEESIGKMTDCLTSLGEGIATGMRMLANAIASTHQPQPQAYPPQFNNQFMGGFAPMYHSDTNSTTGRGPVQFNRNGEQFSNNSTDGEHYMC